LLLSEDKVYRVGIFLLAIILPIISVFLISQRRPIYMDRYFIILVPFLTGLLCYGVKGWRLRIVTLHALPKLGVIFFSTAAFLVIGLIVGTQVHSRKQYAREDWKTLVELIEDEQQTHSLIHVLLSDQESSVALDYYAEQDFHYLDVAALAGFEGNELWAVSRQPYTATHAFAQGVSEPDRETSVPFPLNAVDLKRWESDTGISATLFIGVEQEP
jgi:hypothetical protein